MYHPYSHQQLISGDRYHDRGDQILHRQSCNQYLEGMSNEVHHILNIYIFHITFTSIGSGGVIEVNKEYEYTLLPFHYSL